MYLLLLAILHIFSCTDSRPPAFESILYAKHAPGYYGDQAAAYEAWLVKGCSREEDWVSYFEFARYANKFEGADLDLASIHEQAIASGLDPNGFAYQFLEFETDNDLATRYQKLLKAHRAQTENARAYSGLIAYYEMIGDTEQRDQLFRKWYQHSPLPAGLMDYGYNQLQSTSTNAILLTVGDADTYPSWMLQRVHGIRTDVDVVNWSLLLFAPEYQRTVSARLGLKLTGTDDAATVLAALKRHQRPLYFGITMNTDELPIAVRDSLYLTGLAVRYDDQPYANMEFIEQALANTWRLDRLRQPFAENKVQALNDQIDRNYLPALLELNDHLASTSKEAQAVSELISSIADRTGVDANLQRFQATQRK